MATLRKFSLLDVFEYSNINLDILTETYSCNFYGQYICKWPEYCVTLYNNHRRSKGYLLGKVEGDKQNQNEKRDWHGHVTAVTVAVDSRRQGVARYLMDYLEQISEHMHDAYFVDLFVRASNEIAIKMYSWFGYSTYRIIDKYYTGYGDIKSEDSLDMRKSLSRDPEKELMEPTGKTIKPNDLEFN